MSEMIPNFAVGNTCSTGCGVSSVPSCKVTRACAHNVSVAASVGAKVAA